MYFTTGESKIPEDEALHEILQEHKVPLFYTPLQVNHLHIILTYLFSTINLN